MSQYGADYDAAMAGATLQWRDLGSRQQVCMANAFEWTEARDEKMAKSLCARGLTFDTSRWARVTPMGHLVRQAGIVESKRIEALAAEP